MGMKRIETLDELKELASKKFVYAFIQLNFGLRSSKYIKYNKKTDKWKIFNVIDSTTQVLLTEELGEKTNIIKALEAGALWQY